MKASKCLFCTSRFCSFRFCLREIFLSLWLAIRRTFRNVFQLVPLGHKGVESGSNDAPVVLIGPKEYLPPPPGCLGHSSLTSDLSAAARWIVSLFQRTVCEPDRWFWFWTAGPGRLSATKQQSRSLRSRSSLSWCSAWTNGWLNTSN